MSIDTHQALDNTRRMAHQAMERANTTMQGLRTGMSNRTAAARSYVGEYASAGTRYVGEHPLKSALIAAAVGAAIAGIVIALRHRGDDDTF